MNKCSLILQNLDLKGMPHLNGTGPEGKGFQSGRSLGLCAQTPQEELLKKLGKGMGKRRKSEGGTGHGRRLKSTDQIKNEKNG